MFWARQENLEGGTPRERRFRGDWAHSVQEMEEFRREDDTHEDGDEELIRSRMIRTCLRVLGETR